MVDIDHHRYPIANRLSTHPTIHGVLLFGYLAIGQPILTDFVYSAETLDHMGSESMSAELSRETPRTKGMFLSHKHAVHIGLEQHPAIKKAKETERAAETVTKQTEARYYPELTAYAIQTGGTIRPLSAFNIAGAQNKPTSYVESAGFRADQLLYDFGQTRHRILAQEAGEEATEQEVQTQKAQVIVRVQHAYIQCLRLKRLVEIAEETVRERGVLRDQIAVLYKRQLKSKLDLDLMAIELKSAEVQLVQAKNELRAAFAALNHAMGIRGPEEYTLEDTLSISPPSATLETLIQEALYDRPELLGIAERIRQADETLNSVQAMNYPTISAVAMSGVIHFSDAPVNQYAGSHPGQTNLWWGAGAMVSIPLFTGFLIENRTAETREQKYKVEQKKADLSNRVALEVTDAYLNLHTARQQVKVEEREVDSARSALTLSKERYWMGLASIVEVTTATTALLAASVRLSDARYGILAGTIALGFATGRGLLEY